MGRNLPAATTKRATSDVTVEPPHSNGPAGLPDRDWFSFDELVCKVISDGRPCDLRQGHSGRCWSR